MNNFSIGIFIALMLLLHVNYESTVIVRLTLSEFAGETERLLNEPFILGVLLCFIVGEI